MSLSRTNSICPSPASLNRRQKLRLSILEAGNSFSGGSSDGRAGGLSNGPQCRWFKSSSPVQFVRLGSTQRTPSKLVRAARFSLGGRNWQSDVRLSGGGLPPCRKAANRLELQDLNSDHFPLQCGFIRRESGLKKPHILPAIYPAGVNPSRPEKSTQGGTVFQ